MNSPVTLEALGPDKADWIQWFVSHLVKLRPVECSRAVTELAHQVYPHLGHLDPIEVAQREFDGRMSRPA
jgi:hypothetical protein